MILDKKQQNFLNLNKSNKNLKNWKIEKIFLKILPIDYAFKIVQTWRWFEFESFLRQTILDIYSIK